MEKNYTALYPGKNTQTLSREDELHLEVTKSLSGSRKWLPCQLFYDNRGMDLFEQICDLDEYYITRAEISILNDYIEEIVRLIDRKSVLIELGSGSIRKVKVFLDHLPDLVSYIPVDISEESLLNEVRKLSSIYLDLRIIPVVQDYTKSFDLPVLDFEHQKKVIYFPGSSIGNFHPEKGRDFMKRIAKMTGKGSIMLIGIDLKKKIEILERAYNDKSGVTAEFNLNILKHLNHLVGSNFDISEWRHKAFYNIDKSRIEMHLVSLCHQTVSINDSIFSFKEGETIHTENSYKYSEQDFEALLKDFCSLKNIWKDEKNQFGLFHFEVI